MTIRFNGKPMSLDYQGFTVPRVLHHGTTETFVDSYVEKDGVYRVPFGSGIWATGGDSRAWPKHMRLGWKKATVIIDSEAAYEGIEGVQTGPIFRFDHLPAGSYEIFKQSNWPTDGRNAMHNSLKYQVRLDEIAKELLKRNGCQ